MDVEFHLSGERQCIFCDILKQNTFICVPSIFQCVLLVALLL